jgi:hypothetical protein
MTVRTIAFNASGRRVGDTHHNARLTDGEVELVLEMHKPADGKPGMGYKAIATKLDVSKSLIRNICKGTARWQLPVRWRKVYVSD